MMESLRRVDLTALRMVLCGFLFSFAPLAARTQTIDETAILDTWRVSFNHQLDDQIRGLASAHHFATISTPSGAQGEQDHSPSQASSSPGLAYHEPANWPSAVRGILQDQGLPMKLIGVVAVESGFNSRALSPKGAAGPWQLMPDTARQFGLVVSATQDDRFDILKSTIAAAHYLRRLYDQFGDWPLALAAYNAGPNRVAKGLNRFNARSFWTLSRDFALPEETRDYVPRVLAAMRTGLVSQTLYPQHSSSWNGLGEAQESSSKTPYRKCEVVFAMTAPEASSSENAK